MPHDLIGTAGYGGGASTSIPPSASRTESAGNAGGGVGSWWLHERAVHRERRARGTGTAAPGRARPAAARSPGACRCPTRRPPARRRAARTRPRRRRRSRARRRRAGRCWRPPGSTCRRSGRAGPRPRRRAACSRDAIGDRSHREARGGHRAELQHATAAAADRHHGVGSSSSSSVARRRRRSATNSSLAAPLPARPARSSIAARIWAASSSSGRKPRVRLPRNRSSTNRRTLMPAPHPAARRGAAPGAAAPWRWPR